MVNSKVNSRIVWLDALKGIGILLVIISHSNLQLPFMNFFTAGYIQLFFIAAGFTYKSSLKPFGFVEKKSQKTFTTVLYLWPINIIVLHLSGGAKCS